MNIAKLIADRKTPFYSFEFFPPKEEDQLPAFYDRVERLQALNPLFASVTYGAGGSRKRSTVGLVTSLKKNFGFEVMSHLTCVGSSREDVDTMLGDLQEKGIYNILALRGDMPKDPTFDISHTEFHHAIELVQYIREKFPEFGIGVAGYPAPHPESPSFSSDWRYTVAKIRAGADFVITQLFFDVREYFNFVDRLSDMGVSIPIIPGILPVQSMASLRRTLSTCGANIPGKLYLELEAAEEKGGPEAVKDAGIAYAVSQIRTLLDNGAPGIHLYTLNNAATCLRIADAVGPLAKSK